MAYSVNWTTKLITIPTSDLNLVSGDRYELQMSDFLIEIRRLESSFVDGLWAEQILAHDNARLDFAGADYPPLDEIINGYTVTISGSAVRCDLKGSNNNFIDVYVNTNGCSVVPSNSLGLQLVSVGSGLSPEEQTQLSDINNRSDEMWRRLDLDVNKPNTYNNDGTQITNDDYTLDRNDNGNGSFTIQRS